MSRGPSCCSPSHCVGAALGVGTGPDRPKSGVGAQPLQRRLDHGADVIRFAVELARALAGGGIDIEPESGCDIDLVAHRGEPAADFQTVFNPVRWRFRWVLPK